MELCFQVGPSVDRIGRHVPEPRESRSRQGKGKQSNLKFVLERRISTLRQKTADVLHGGGVVVPSELSKIGYPEVIGVWYPIEVLRVRLPVSCLALRLDDEVVPDDGRELLF